MPLNTIPNKGLTSRGYPSDRITTPIIINGDMQVAQRGAGPSGAFSGSGYSEGPDRFRHGISNLGNWKTAQSTTVPTGQGFSKSFKIECSTADASPAASDEAAINYRLEGQNLQSLKKGTSNAEAVTIAFWVRSTKTGTHIVELFDADNSRTVSQAYTVSASDTWEKKVLNFPADTTGALDNDNARSLQINFWLGAGSDFTSGTLATTWASQTNANRAVGQVNLADSTSNEWYITGLQLEVGEFDSTTIPSFPFESFENNLRKCLRYYEKSYDYSTTPATNTETGTVSINGLSTSSKQIRSHDTRYYSKRTAPTVTIYDVAGNSGRWRTYDSGGSGTDNVSGIAVITKGIQSFQVYQNGTVAAGYQYHFTSDAEL